MEVLSLTAVLATIFGWCVLASWLGRPGLTAPIVLISVLAHGFSASPLSNRFAPAPSPFHTP